MTKEKYYACFEEYNRLVREMDFNPGFFEQGSSGSRLQEVCDLLRKQLLSMKTLVVLYGRSDARMLNRIDCLGIAVGQLRPVREEEYRGTYVEELWFGFLKTRHLPFVLAAMAAAFVVMKYFV